MGTSLLSRIEKLPNRYSQEKLILTTLAQECKTKTQLKKSCHAQLRHYENSLAQDLGISDRLTNQLKQCKKIMHNCAYRVLPLL